VWRLRACLPISLPRGYLFRASDGETHVEIAATNRLEPERPMTRPRIFLHTLDSEMAYDYRAIETGTQ
jgi:hypothetical protein